MKVSAELDRLHQRARENVWLRYFAVFNRIALAAGFLIAGGVKILGERFAEGLSANHPMGHYLEALYHTGYYYPFIGYLQVLAAVLLLVPRTATLGAVIYFPIILNICVLSLAVRFDGSLVSSPLMVLANLYLLCWDYDKLKPLLAGRHPAAVGAAPVPARRRAFPARFFGGVAVAIAAVVLVVTHAYDVMPRNSFADCQQQFVGTHRTRAGYRFCDCIHHRGKPLEQGLAEYSAAPNDAVKVPAGP